MIGLIHKSFEEINKQYISQMIKMSSLISHTLQQIKKKNQKTKRQSRHTRVENKILDNVSGGCALLLC